MSRKPRPVWRRQAEDPASSPHTDFPACWPDLHGNIDHERPHMTTFPSHCKKQNDRQAPPSSVTGPDQGRGTLARISSAKGPKSTQISRGWISLVPLGSWIGNIIPQQINSPLDRRRSNLFQQAYCIQYLKVLALKVNEVKMFEWNEFFFVFN